MTLQQKQSSDLDIDDLLSIVGLGRYQYRIIILISLLVGFSSISPVSFILTASDLNYRCKIDECDNLIKGTNYKEPWLIDAIPYYDKEKEIPFKCYKYVTNNIKNSNNKSKNNNISNCSSANQMFNSNEIQKCNEFVYETQERTILTDFDDVKCEENKWKLTSVGTINNIAQFIGIPLSGMLSDRFGRKRIIISLLFLSSTFGIIRSFSRSYIMFVVFEFLDSFFSSGIYPSAFILAQELMTPSHRPIAGMLVNGTYPIGAAILGLVTWFFMDWRKTTLACYIPSFLFLSYCWFIPESIRWLQTHGEHDNAIKVVKKMSKENRKLLPENTLQYVRKMEYTKKPIGFGEAVKASVQSKKIMFNLLISSCCWFANTMVYYGLSFNATDLAGSKFTNFIIVNLVDIPACMLSGILLRKVKRRLTQSSVFLITGFGCILCEFMPNEASTLKLLIYMLSKFTIAISYATFSVYTGEIFPTELRLSLYSLSSTFGRIGSMLAPQTSLLKDYLGTHAAVFLFGGIAITTGILSLTLPETFGKKLSDTVNDDDDEKI